MTSLSLAVCAHISRTAVAKELATSLDDCPIAWDDGTVGSVRNHDRALRQAALVPADWVIVLEDDAQPIPDFKQQAAAALDTCPLPFASLYYGYVGSPDERIAAELADRDPNWVMRQGLANAVCFAVRYEQVGPLFRELREDNLPADHRWAEAINRLGHRWLPHAHPSLVEHGDEGSLIAGDTSNFPRKAYRVGRREHWTGATI